VGERVELNAMRSRPFIDFLERKLAEAGAAKVVPGADVLAAAYRRARVIGHLQAALRQAAEECSGDDAAVPPGLTDAVRQRIQGTATAWDEAVWQIAQGVEPAR
jgi:hypothetical protein